MRQSLVILGLLFCSMAQAQNVYEFTDSVTTGSSILSEGVTTSYDLSALLGIQPVDFPILRPVLSVKVKEQASASQWISIVQSTDPSIDEAGSTSALTGLIVSDGETVFIRATRPILHVTPIDDDSTSVTISIVRVN